MNQSKQQELFGTFSDMYKDLNGFRPRPRPRHIDTTTWSEESFARAFEEMSAEIAIQIDQENLIQSNNVVMFEKRINDVIAIGAGDRKTAIRWLHDAEHTDGDDDYLCFLLNIPYGHIRQGE